MSRESMPSPPIAIPTVLLMTAFLWAASVDAQETPKEVSGVGLSDDDVDRIARRLLELAADRIEHIAWDVIPDMAEVVVRERMREIEAEAERDPS